MRLKYISFLKFIKKAIKLVALQTKFFDDAKVTNG